MGSCRRRILAQGLLPYARGMAHALPTGRNFYSLDPRAVPSPLAWQVGSLLAERLLEAHVAEEGRYPQSVGLVVWGTAAMRTSAAVS